MGLQVSAQIPEFFGSRESHGPYYLTSVTLPLVFVVETPLSPDESDEKQAAKGCVKCDPISTMVSKVESICD